MTTFNPTRRYMMAAGSLVLVPAIARAQAAPVVDTAYGRVRGFTRPNGVHVFKGVPYGDTTAGANRFMPPKPPRPWAGVKDCVVYGPETPQGAGPEPDDPTRTPDGYASLYARRHEEQSEDCLVLNIWTPALDNRKRPVMFWIHGGGFSTGSGASYWYDGTNVTKKQDVVVVTINHRLNVFGYAHLGAFNPRFADSSNSGTLDCVQALKWVKENIERFGGDPTRVMVHGQSGGGRKTSMVLSTTPAQGLYQRAVIQSGAQIRVDSLESAAAKTRRLLTALNIAPSEVEKLQQVPMLDIQKVQGQAAGGQWMPAVGSPSLPGHPCDPTAPAMSKNVPIMIGTCRTEQSGFMGGSKAMDTLTEAALVTRLDGVQRGQGQALLAMYKRLYPRSSNAEIAYMAATDRGYFLDSTIYATRRAEAGGAPTFYYSFDRETPVDGGRFFAPHAEEIPFVFDSLQYGANIAGEPTVQSQALADKVSALWANFARNGVPSAPGVPAWTPYNTANRPTMVINDVSRIVNDNRGEQRRTMLAFGSQQMTNGGGA